MWQKLLRNPDGCKQNPPSGQRLGGRDFTVLPMLAPIK